MNLRFVTRLLGVWTAFNIVCCSGKKGYESHDESTGEEESTEIHKEKKKNTGAQNKFWIPTYPGTNPLNRRKIEITNSEIERFDSSIDVSLSGVMHNGTRAPRVKKYNPKEEEKDLSKLPFVLSGEDLSRNITIKDLASMDSSLITDESWKSREEDSTEFKRNYSPFTWNKNNSSEEKSSSDQSESSSSKSEKSEYIQEKIKRSDKKTVNIVHTTHKPVIKKATIRKETKTKKTFDPTKKVEVVKTTKTTLTSETRKPSEKSKVYASEKSETSTSENILTREYYQKMVEAAVDNTKRKLGYQKLSLTNQVRRTFKPIVPDSLEIDSKDSPEIFKVNMDSKSTEKVKVKTEEEIHFATKHHQIIPTASSVGTVKERSKEKREERKDRVKALANDLVGKIEKQKLKHNFTESEMDDISKQTAVDFPSSCDYEAWSDVLLKNRTQRKSKQRKPKTGKLSSSYERLSGDMRAWPGKQIREKAEELRKKEGKLTRKEKRKIEKRKKKEEKKAEKRQKGKKEVAIRKDGKRFDEYQDFPGAGEETGGKSDFSYDFKEDYKYDDSPKRGKGGARKNYDYDSYNDFYDSSEKGKKKPIEKKGPRDKKDFDSENPKRKFRMTTEGEKRRAYGEVKSYLKEMDEEYGGRPGNDAYYRDNRRRGGRNDRGSRDRGRGWDRRGGDRGKFSTGGRGRGGYDRGRERGFDRGGGRGGFDRGGGREGFDRGGGRGGFDRGGGRRGYDRGGDNWDDRDRGGRWDDQGGRWDDRRGMGRGRDDREKGRDRRRGQGDRRWGGGRGGRGRGRGGGGRRRGRGRS